MPVDIVSTKEFSQLMAGTLNAPKAEKPKPLVDKVADPKPVEDPLPKVSQKPPIEATQSAPPPPPPPPEPKPEQKDSKPAEPAVDTIAEALKKEQAKQAEQKKLEEQRQLEQKKLEEQKKAEEQKKREEARKRAEAKRIEDAKKREEMKKNEERIAELLNKTDPRREAATGAVANQAPNLGAPTGTAPTLSQSELDAMRAKLRDHWSPDEAIFERPDQYVVLVRVQIGRNRMLAAPPQVVSTGSGPLYQATAEAAKRAILLSQPFDMLSLTTYDTWKDMEIDFNPRELRNR
ncbi:MAG: protein TolA [Bradyrhizobiaceae bacterium]|nr:protein TolA [Bradyrhizobiaceae bacterium]